MEWNGTQITQITQIEIKNYGYMLNNIAPDPLKGTLVSAEVGELSL
jgi:hypothetical protein